MLIAGFIPNSFVDWRGKMVATVFTYGCNLRCPFCHNYTLVTEKPKRFIDEEEVFCRIKELGEWIDGVCITGGEPTIHQDLPDFVRKLSKITPVKLDTNGTNSEMLEQVLPYISYVAMDVKAPKQRYSELAGVYVNANILERSIELIKSRARDYEFRTTVVPILTKSDFVKIAEWLSGARRYVLQQYSTKGGTLDPEFQKLKPHDEEYLKEICEEIENHFEECIVANI